MDSELHRLVPDGGGGIRCVQCDMHWPKEAKAGVASIIDIARANKITLSQLRLRACTRTRTRVCSVHAPSGGEATA